jgi:uncharacterized protein YdaU (DUF1376 family)
MADFPALPLWTDAYLSDTRELSTLEHGAYLLLLMTAWRTADCSLPDDDRLLARWAGLDRRTWARVRPIMERLWTISEGRWTQKRLAKERFYVNKLACARRASGHAGARAKALKKKEARLAKLERSLSKTEAPTPTPNSVDTSKDISTGVPPDFHDPDKALWDAGRALLKEAGKSDAAARSIIGKWLKLHGREATAIALGRAKREGAIEPVSFVEACFKAAARAKADADDAPRWAGF